MKKLFVILLFVIGNAFDTYAYDFSAVCQSGQTLYYTILTSNTVEVSGNRATGDLVIPSNVQYNGVSYTITAIAEEGFENDQITSVVIPNSVRTIKKEAFYACENLNSVDFGNGVQEILDGAFESCSELLSVVLPNSLISIGKESFQFCSNLSSLSLGNSIKSIGENAFCQCYGLRTVTIPSSVEHLAEWAFFYCTSLETVYFNAKNCSGGSPFISCTSLKELHIGNTVESIGDFSFASCSELTGDLIIPNSVKSIGQQAFHMCSKITSVTIPESVEIIKYCAFYDCNSLSVVNFNSIDCEVDKPFWGRCNVSQINFGDNVKHIPEGICSGQTNISALVIPNSVQTIGSRAFYGCTGITGSVSIPVSVVEIGSLAFKNCSGITGSINIPNSTVFVGSSAFSGCSSISCVTIGESVQSMVHAFTGCSSLNQVYYKARNCADTDIAFRDCPSLRKLVIEEGVISIPDYIFFNCSSIDSIIFPSSINQIGSNSFSNCTGVSFIRLHTINAPTIYCNSFTGVSRNTPIVVACRSKEDYLRDEYWSWFQNITEDCNDCEELISLKTLIFPNPTDGIITIEDDNVQLIEIYRINGQMIKEMFGNVIDITDQEAGTYIIKVITPSGIITKQIIKK